MIFPPLPYAAIGKATVVLVAAVLLVVALVLGVLAALFVWYRGWTLVSKLLWRGYDWEVGERPPLWRVQLSGVCIAIRNRELQKIPEVVENAKKIAATDDEDESGRGDSPRRER